MTLDELYVKVYADDSVQDSNVFLGIFDAHKEIVENVTLDGKPELHSKVMRLRADYAHQLTLKENYSRAIPQIEKALVLFQSHPDYQDKDLYKIGFYEKLIFDRAISNYYLKNFHAANQDLKELRAKFPDNERYKTWMAASKSQSTQTLINALWFVVGAAVLLTTFIDQETMGFVYDTVLYIGAIALFAVLSAEGVKVLNKKKIQVRD